MPAVSSLCQEYGFRVVTQDWDIFTGAWAVELLSVQKTLPGRMIRLNCSVIMGPLLGGGVICAPNDFSYAD